MKKYFIIFSIITAFVNVEIYASLICFDPWEYQNGSYAALKEYYIQKRISYIAFDGLLYGFIDLDYPDYWNYTASDEEEWWSKWRADKHTLELVVCGYEEGMDLDVLVIPDKVRLDWSNFGNHMHLMFGLEQKSDSYYLPVAGIKGDAFSDCKNLTSVTLPSSIRSIQNGAFENCSQLTAINLSNVSFIDYSAFKGCSALTSVTFSENLGFLGDECFAECSSLRTPIVFPSSIAFVGDAVFRGCSSLPSVDMSKYIPFKYVDCTSMYPVDFEGCSNLVSICLYDSLKCISSFAGCSSLTDIKIPEGVMAITPWAFENCSSLKSIVIPKNVRYSECGEYSNYEGGEYVRDFRGDYTANFTGCSSLKRITFNCPNIKWADDGVSVESLVLGECVENVRGLTEAGHDINTITVSDNNIIFDSRYNCNAVIDSKTNTLLLGSNNTFIPEDVTAIGSFAFQGLNGLTTITIPENVTYVNGLAFCGCHGLTSLTIDTQNVNNWGWGLFEGNLLCSPKEVTFGPHVRKIENFGADSWEKINFLEGTVSIGMSAFSGCRKLKEIAFPRSLLKIGERAFRGCYNLNKITFPSTLQEIGEEAFMDCFHLDSVVSYMIEPIQINRNVFESSDYHDEYPKNYIYRNATLYVPIRENYVNQIGWGHFQHIEEMKTTGITNSSFQEDNPIEKIYGIDGKSYKRQHRGVNIVLRTNGTIHKVLVK